MRQLAAQRFAFRTLPALLRQTAATMPSRCFARELLPSNTSFETRSTTFAEFEAMVASCSEYLVQAGIAPHDRILFLAENGLDYQILELATQSLRAWPCVVFASLGSAAVADIALRVRPSVVFVSTKQQWEKLEPVVRELLDAGLRLRLCPESLSPIDGFCDATLSEVKSTPFERARYDARVETVGPSDPFLLLFTSGTTGRQKGVCLTQDAFVRSLEGGRSATAMTELDSGLMFLPFAHVAGQCQFMLAVAVGHSLILVAQRSLLRQAFALGPTYCFAVPMVYEKLRDEAVARLQSLPTLLRRPLLVALASTSRPTESQQAVHRLLGPVARWAVGRRLRQALGGNLRFLASGGAATPPALSRFFESMGLPFISFYGMSETSGLIASQCVDTPRGPGTVGYLASDLLVRISSEGELCLKGPMLMQGYLDEPDGHESYDEDGFFRTGDFATRNEETGELTLVGRKKSLLVLSTGKKLSPEPIEEALTTLSHVTTALVIGDARPYVSAILFVDPALGSWSKTERDSFAATMSVAVARELKRFSDYERPKRLLLIASDLAARPELLTPTLKLKRANALQVYRTAIEQLYTADAPVTWISS